MNNGKQKFFNLELCNKNILEKKLGDRDETETMEASNSGTAGHRFDWIYGDFRPGGICAVSYTHLPG